MFKNKQPQISRWDKKIRKHNLVRDGRVIGQNIFKGNRIIESSGNLFLAKVDSRGRIKSCQQVNMPHTNNFYNNGNKWDK
jgi:hypothetical protein